MSCCHPFAIAVSGYSTYMSSPSKQVRSPRRYAVSWTALIFHHVKCGQSAKALRMYDRMRQSGERLSSYTFVAALKACSYLKDLQSARQIHAQVIACGLEFDVYVGTMLVDVYIKCGSLVDARNVFETMPCRDVVPWNALIMGYAQMDNPEVALRLYGRMKQEGLVPNDRTFVSALRACSSLVARKGGDGTMVRQLCLERLKAIHSDVVKGGFESNMFVGNMLVDAYSKCGSPVDARHVFENMPRRDVITWNTMISGLAQMKDGDEALQLFSRMRKEGVLADDRTFVAALKACSSSISAAEARDGGDATLLKQKCLDHVRRIHEELVKHGCEWDVFVATTLVDVYARCGHLGYARDVFERMPHRDVVSWNAMILGYVQVEMGQEALQMYAQMQGQGVAPNEGTVTAVLRAYYSLVTCQEGNRRDGQHVQEHWVEDVRVLQAHMVKAACKLDANLGNVFLSVYAKCGSMVDAICVFESIPHRNLLSWTTIISGYADLGECKVALRYYNQMQQEGVMADSRTFVAALKACRCLVAFEGDEKQGSGLFSESLCMEQVKAIHLDAIKAGLGADLYVGTMLVDVYAKCGGLKNARHVFQTMPLRNVVSWTAMITGYAQMDDGEEALRLYAQMQREGVAPNGRTFLGVLKACGSVAGLEKGKEIHAQICNSGLELSSPFVASGLIDMYGRCGSMRDAQHVFDELATKNVVTWSALIAGYARTGNSEAVFQLLESMIQGGVPPDGVTFLSVLSVCSHLGLLEKGENYFKAMSTEFGVCPTLEHYTCLVDLFGRAGHLDRAVQVIRRMPCQPDGAVWESILGACQKWSGAKLGRHAFETAVGLENEDGAQHAVMANTHAGTYTWKESKDMEAPKRQEPGLSWWTDCGGIVHLFFVGHEQHSNTHRVHLKLESLFVMLKQDG